MNEAALGTHEMRRRVADFGDQPAERRQPTALIRRSRATETQALSDQPAVSTTIDIEIEVQGRWDALALSELLIPFHSFLVQHDHERWVVHARRREAALEPVSQQCANHGECPVVIARAQREDNGR